MGTSTTQPQSLEYRGPVGDLLKLLARNLLERWTRGTGSSILDSPDKK
jgi:hypothetical protein